MDIDIKRLEWDAAYWDEVAPEGATHCAGNPDNQDGVEWESKLGNSRRVYDSENKMWKGIAWKPSIELKRFYKYVIPRPKPQSQEWDGEGMPPVGCECEARAFKDGEWEAVKVLAYPKDEYQTYIVVQSLDEQDWWWRGIGEGFEARPIRTQAERERANLAYLMLGDDEFFIPDWVRLKVADKILAKYELKERT